MARAQPLLRFHQRPQAHARQVADGAEVENPVLGGASRPLDEPFERSRSVPVEAASESQGWHGAIRVEADIHGSPQPKGVW